MDIQRNIRNTLQKEVLLEVSLRELLSMESLPSNLYAKTEKENIIALKKDVELTSNTLEILKHLVAKNRWTLAIDKSGKKSIVEYHQNRLRNISKRLREGHLLNNGAECLNSTAINLSYLYKDSTNDNILSTQCTCAQSLASFLLEHINLHSKLYQLFVEQKHENTTAVPIISSLFLLGIAKRSKMFLDKDMEYLFITGLLKDIGLYSSLKDNVSENDRGHEFRSVEILQRRTFLKADYLRIIENHHSMPRPLRNNSTTAIGTKTLLVGITDIIANSLQKNSLTFFESLNVVKNIMAEHYPKEFKLIISYFETFFRD